MACAPTITSIAGFQIAACKAGIKASGNLDIGLILADTPVPAAGVFTLNKVCAAPVTLTKANLKKTKGFARALLVNAGNANACTGALGMKNAKASAKHLANLCAADPSEMLICSTGVIGHQLPMEKLLTGIDTVTSKPGKGDFSKAIMTTDLVQKKAGVAVSGLGKIAGVCKGSGMIAPNMATMLGFILTDIAIAPAPLQEALSYATARSFNCVTVDGDTSTNDCTLVMASGKAGNTLISSPSGKAYLAFRDGLTEVCIKLAKMIARDGEGATKLVEIALRGAKNTKQARLAARTVAESPLVKTALYGNDPNWGRILAALGRSGAQVNESKTIVKVAGTALFADGAPQPFTPAKVSKAMKKKDLFIEIDLGLGDGEATFFTCDFSYDYVKINAEYHT